MLLSNTVLKQYSWFMSFKEMMNNLQIKINTNVKNYLSTPELYHPFPSNDCASSPKTQYYFLPMSNNRTEFHFAYHVLVIRLIEYASNITVKT
jgi:hypothetical protein